jgi:hypothetical protein
MLDKHAMDQAGARQDLERVPTVGQGIKQEALIPVSKPRLLPPREGRRLGLVLVSVLEQKKRPRRRLQLPQKQRPLWRQQGAQRQCRLRCQLHPLLLLLQPLRGLVKADTAGPGEAGEAGMERGGRMSATVVVATSRLCGV